MVWALILSAGESKRMGEPKMLLPFGRNTIIETIIRSALDSRVEKVLVVLGSDRDEIMKKIGHFPVETVVNPEFELGMLSSIQAGFRALHGTVQAAVVILGDQPLIPHEAIDTLIDKYRETGKGIIQPAHKGKRGHPVLIDTKYRDEIQHLDPEVGLRALIHAHLEDVHQVEVDTPAILQDIDTKKDYFDQK